jgi:hypothetical protein
MQNPLIDGIIVFLILLAGAYAGWTMRQRLPEHQLTDDTKSLISVSMAVVATVSALVLGLLISNANTSFRALGGDVTTLSAQILRLDNILRRYGPDTYPARETLRRYAEQKTADLFPDQGADVRLDDPSTYALLLQVEDSMLELKPSNPRDQWWLDQATTLAGKIGDTRWLLVQQLGQGTPKAVLALLVFWLTLLFASFGSVRAAQLNIWGNPDAMRPSGSRRRWNDPGIGKRLRGIGPYLATADAAGCPGFGTPIK